MVSLLARIRTHQKVIAVFHVGVIIHNGHWPTLTPLPLRTPHPEHPWFGALAANVREAVWIPHWRLWSIPDESCRFPWTRKAKLFIQQKIFLSRVVEDNEWVYLLYEVRFQREKGIRYAIKKSGKIARRTISSDSPCIQNYLHWSTTNNSLALGSLASGWSTDWHQPFTETRNKSHTSGVTLFWRQVRLPFSGIFNLTTQTQEA